MFRCLQQRWNRVSGHSADYRAYVCSKYYELARLSDTASKFTLFSFVRFERRKVESKPVHELKTKTCKLYSSLFLESFKYFELYRFKVGAFLRQCSDL